MKLKKTDLQALRKRLPKGYTLVAIERLKKVKKSCSHQYLLHVLKGDRFDEKVLEVLCDIADAHELKMKKLSLRARGKATAN